MVRRKYRSRRRPLRWSLPVLLIATLAYVFSQFPPEWRDRIANFSESLVSPSAPLTPNGGNTTITSFRAAKLLLPDIYNDHRETFYCGCRYQGKVPDLASCGYKIQKNEKRARRIEWEHVVPAKHFGQNFPEWRVGHAKCVDNKGATFKGRNCAGKMSPEFRFMEADLYNLVPAIGEVNGRRSDYRMSMIEGEQRKFGACDVEIKDQRIEPRPEVRGDVARTYMYMEWAYGKNLIASSARKLFEAWRKEDPVDDWERKRAKRIARIQGNVNPFVQ